ncbi:MAG: HEAT repeat domain-containing protein [Pseudomonadota bacterium]
MTRTALLAACLFACTPQPSADEPPPLTQVQTLKIHGAEHYVSLLRWPYDNIMYQDGLRWIRQHPDEAHPVLVARLDERGMGYHHIPRVLAMLGRPEGVPPLERALLSDRELQTEDAGLALGHHPHEDALAALIRALQSDAGPRVIAWAAEGLRQRKDPVACPALKGRLHHPDYSVRFHVLRACAELGCIERSEVVPFVNDPHPDVATLASGLIGGEQGEVQVVPDGRDDE